ncbi:hypothetical protein E1283_27750 [Streptomyces hainanensis]|uniref:ABC transporter n=1 Tax=Streptomyces hainanensis TaxID=402648 RepID=A0A4R4SVK5_9ACTN|nr:hypothetical protein E1283_27750 [Streptomyces hainanensis]
MNLGNPGNLGDLGTRRRRLALAAAVPLLLAGCGGGSGGGDRPGDGDGGSEAPEVPHGYVAGAEEAAEPQPRLVVAEAGTGAVRVLDLATEDVTEVDAVDAAAGVDRLTGDGRYGYLATADGTVTVVDGGAWTVDHGDHAHYYRAEPRTVGELPGGGALLGAHADVVVTALTYDDGSVVLLDREALGAGEIAEAARFDADAGAAAVPFEGRVLVPGAESVAVYDREGTRVGALDQPCPEPAGAASTRYGVVLSCADGALLVTADDAEGGDALVGEPIGYPEGTEPADRAGAFGLRPGSGTVVAPAGERDVWTLDLAERAWTRTGTGPVLAAAAPGDGATVLALALDGTLRAYALGGTEKAAAADPVTGPVLAIDTSRAYVNDPAAGVVHEYDYADDLRLARTLDPGVTPDLLVETGR